MGVERGPVEPLRVQRRWRSGSRGCGRRRRRAGAAGGRGAAAAALPRRFGRWSAVDAVAAAVRRPRPGPDQCHDITVYPAIGLAGGACGGYGLLLDIRDVANPKRIDAAADSNFSFWHSATFSNDGTKVLFSDEWGGGAAPRCRVDRQLRVGRRRALHDRRRQDDVPELLQDAGARRRRGRTAWRTTAR